MPKLKKLSWDEGGKINQSYERKKSKDKKALRKERRKRNAYDNNFS